MAIQSAREIGQADLSPEQGRPGHTVIVVAAIALFAAAVMSLATGSTGVRLWALPGAISSVLGHSSDPADARAALVLLDLRLPRTLLAMFVGGALAVSGTMMQGLFRNPLADPGLVGVSSGASLAAISFIVLGNTYLGGWQNLMGIYALPMAAFLGGLTVTMLLMKISSWGGETTIATLLLAGIAFGALTGALSGVLTYISNDRELRDVAMWSLGSFAGASWQKVAAVTPFAIVLVLSLPGLVRALNGLLLGEAEAFHLGIDLDAAKRRIVLLTALAVGASVAMAGMIGFVGIVVPHVIRMIAGPDHRVVLPAAALGGGVLVLVADIIARVIVAPAELPIGIIMAAIGAPVFLNLVLKRSSRVVM